MLRKQTHEIELGVDCAEVFQLLITPSAIRKWWSATSVVVIPQPGGTWTAAWGEDEDDPDFITTATIEVFEPAARMILSEYKYFSSNGPLPFEAEFRTEFSTRPCKDGCILRVEQDGFPDDPEADEFYDGCKQGWQETFQAIERYLAESSPASQ